MSRSGESSGAPDRALELLVPEGGELRAEAQAVADFARGLTGGGEVGAAAAPSPREARLAFEEEVRARSAGAIEDLLVHHLRAVYAGRSFLSLPPVRTGVQAAWEGLADLRGGRREAPGVPEPGESPLAVAARLLEGLYRLDHDPATLELWRARLEHASGGARAGERAFRERLEHVPARGAGSRTFAALGVAACECLFDRGALREARALLDELPEGASGVTGRRLQRLRSWSRLLLGEVDADGPEPSPEDPGQELPNSLVQLRRDWPEALSALAGREVQAPSMEAQQGEPWRWRPFRAESPVGDRRRLGAVALAVFAFGPARTAHSLHVDVAPGLRRRVDAWLADRDGACCVPTRPEHALVIEATTRRLHGAPPPSGLGDRSLAAALVPVLDDEGEAAGWVHLEWEHHLIPDEETLLHVARSWRARVLRAASGANRTSWTSDRVGEPSVGLDGWTPGDASKRTAEPLEEPARRLCAGTFEAFVETLGLKLRQRRWWGFAHERGRTSYVTSGGEGLEELGAAPGGARGLDRCLATSGVVRFDEPDAHLALHAGSASGLVLPFVDEGRVVGLVAVESSRRRDFRPEEVTRFAECARDFALSLTIARFRAWHLERFGFDLHLDTSRSPFRAFAARLAAAARSHSPVVLCGPSGAGKRVFARWLHWNRGRESEELDVVHAELDLAEATRGAFAARLGRERGGLILDAPEALAPALQEELLRFLEGEPGAGGGEATRVGGPRARLLVTTTRPLAEAVEVGALRPELAARLERFQMFVPALRDRRQDVPGLVDFLARRFAAEEGALPPRFDDGALALLWRQPWPGNLRELEGFVFKLVLLHAGEDIGPELVREVAREFKLELADKLPPRRPRRGDLVQALRTTLKHTGRLNKRRAALYMGWDPDTLVARMEEFGLDLDALAGEPEGWLS